MLVLFVLICLCAFCWIVGYLVLALGTDLYGLCGLVGLLFVMPGLLVGWFGLFTI